jgi:hypothetical protein
MHRMLHSSPCIAGNETYLGQEFDLEGLASFSEEHRTAHGINQANLVSQFQTKSQQLHQFHREPAHAREDHGVHCAVAILHSILNNQILVNILMGYLHAETLDSRMHAIDLNSAKKYSSSEEFAPVGGKKDDCLFVDQLALGTSKSSFDYNFHHSYSE